MTDEIWKPIKDFEDSYEVSSKGRVRSLYGTAQERHSKNSINKGRSRSVVQSSLHDELISIYPSFAEVKRKLGYDASYIRRKCYFEYGNNIAFGFKRLTYEEYERRNTESH